MSYNAKQLLAFLAIGLFVIAVIGLGPMITIWSLNTVFSLNIAYNFWTWLGTLWLGAFITGNKFNKG